MLLAPKRTDHAGADDVLAQHNVHIVDEILQMDEDWGRLGHGDHRKNHYDAHGDQQHTTHLVIDLKGQDNAHDGKDRHGQHHLARHDDRLLNHVDIAEGTRDHGAGSKPIEIACRKLQGFTIDRAADVAGNPRSQARRQIRSGHRATRGHSGRPQHEQAVIQEVFGRSCRYAYVDHIREHRGNQQRSRVIDQQDEQGEGDEPLMGFEETHERFHTILSSVIGFLLESRL